MSRIRFSLVATVVIAAAAPARAYDSVCYLWPDTSLDPDAYMFLNMTPGKCTGKDYAGPVTMRGRWIGVSDEHRRIFVDCAAQAGLPAPLLGTNRLVVFAADGTVPLAPGLDAQSYAPANFADAKRVVVRDWSVPELAQLPDFSYGLWDWASGDESCPIPGAEALPGYVCHGFATHMGAVNSNHFLPQAAEFFRYYHGLAVARAGDCKAMADATAAAGARFDSFVLACEEEALALEAVGHHYLQDAWSTGHMWQRWGSPDLADFPGNEPEERRGRALLIAMLSGLVHGARGVLQDALDPTSMNTEVNDALCAPMDPKTVPVDYDMYDSLYRTLPPPSFVRAMGPMAPVTGIGDLYLDKLAAHPEQNDRLKGCAASALREVYGKTAMKHGGLGPLSATPMPAPADWVNYSRECFSQRVTNESMYAALGIDVLDVKGMVQQHVQLDARLASLVAPGLTLLVTSVGKATVTDEMVAQLQLDLVKTSWLSAMRAADPDTAKQTTLAEGGLPDILGVHPNGAYVKPALATYIDPALPWPGAAAGAAPTDPRAALARTFHRAHAADWCAATTGADLDALRAHAKDGSLDAEGRAAACEACAELAVRHLRIGTDAAHYNKGAEPLCTYLAPNPVYRYQPSAGSLETPLSVARSYCGCDETLVLTNLGIARVQLQPPAAAVVPIKGAGLLPAGKGPYAMTAAFGRGPELVVTNNLDGNLSIFDMTAGRERELDADFDPATTTPGAPAGITRIAVGASPRGLAATDDGRYVLVATGDADKLAVVDLYKRKLCKSFPIPPAPGDARTEPYFVAVARGQGKAYVSIPGTADLMGTSTSGNIAIIDIARATDCAQSGGEVKGKVAGMTNCKWPANLAVSADGTWLAVACEASDQISYVDVASDTATKQSFATQPWAVSWDPATPHKLWIGRLRGRKGYSLANDGNVSFVNLDTGAGSYDVAVLSLVSAVLPTADGQFVFAGDVGGHVTGLPLPLWDGGPGHVPNGAANCDDPVVGGCLANACLATECPTGISLGGGTVRWMMRY